MKVFWSQTKSVIEAMSVIALLQNVDNPSRSMRMLIAHGNSIHSIFTWFVVFSEFLFQVLIISLDLFAGDCVISVPSSSRWPGKTSRVCHLRV